MNDAAIRQLLDDEARRQKEEINLIASENIVSESVMTAMGSVMTNKYAEGYPARRWYNGCDVVDEAERLAQSRAGDLFGAEAVNVQPHSGSQANMAATFALAKPGAKILAMDLAHGGHLTHGSPANYSGKLYEIIPYGVDRESGRLDYDAIARLADEHKPDILLAGASAYSRTLDFPRFREIADSVDAKLLVDMAHIAGLVAAGVHPSPVPYADIVTTTTHKTLRGPRGGMILCRKKYKKKVDSQVFPGIQGGPLMHIIAAKAVAFAEAATPEFTEYQTQVVRQSARLAEALTRGGLSIVSGGTDNHLFMADVTAKIATGAQAADRLQEAGLIVNKNAIPFDTLKITETSGVRIGSQLVCSRGFGDGEFDKIAEWILRALDGDDTAAIRRETLELASGYPITPAARAEA